MLKNIENIFSLLRIQRRDRRGDSAAPVATLRVKSLEAEPLRHQGLEDPGHLQGERPLKILKV